MKYFDASAWTGSWPFAFLDAHTPRTLAAHLRAHGIGAALVSPIEAVFAPEPAPANRALLRATRSEKALVPVPVINPALANWREELDACAADSRVKLVRVLPNYHGFRLDSRGMDELGAELVRRTLRLAVQTRLIDERHEWHGLNIKPVSTQSLADFLKRHPHLPTLVGGLGRPDILALLPRHRNLIADLTFAEWHETLNYFLKKVSHRQLVFSSHAPFHITAASKAKVEGQDVPAGKARAIAGENLRAFVA